MGIPLTNWANHVQAGWVLLCTRLVICFDVFAEMYPGSSVVVKALGVRQTQVNKYVGWSYFVLGADVLDSSSEKTNSG